MKPHYLRTWSRVGLREQECDYRSRMIAETYSTVGRSLPLTWLNVWEKGSVATLQVARDRLAGCSSWPLRFAVYSSGGNLSRRSSCWQWGGTCAFPFRTATSRSCSPSGACAPITSPSGGGSSAMARKWNNVCVGDSNQPTTVGVWMRPTSGLRASGCIYTGLWTPPVRRSTSFCRLNANGSKLAGWRFSRQQLELLQR